MILRLLLTWLLSLLVVVVVVLLPPETADQKAFTLPPNDESRGDTIRPLIRGTHGIIPHYLVRLK